MEDKDVGNKYDRQVRLWNPTGQQNINNAKICLIKPTTTASETLKNLVLPGVGSITIIDDGTSVGDLELSTNFFLVDEDYGKNLAEQIALNLNEMNPDVNVVSETKNLDEIVTDVEYWKQFNCVIASRFFDDNFGKLLDTLWDINIPLVDVTSIGFYATLRIYYKEQTIVETHANSLADLRLDKPWQELQDYIDSKDLEKLDNQEFSHVPHSIILTKIYQDLAKKSNGKRPSGRDVRKVIPELRRDDELNLDEAYNQAMQITKDSTELPSDLREILSNENIDKITSNSTIFWIYAKSLKIFYEKHQVLPLSGVLPDMESDTSNYIELQQLYRKKHDEDKQEIKETVLLILAENGRSSDEFNQQYLDVFVKNCRFMQVHTGSKEDISSELFALNEWNPNLITSLKIYLSFLAVSKYFKSEGEFPKLKDRSELRTTAIAMLCKYQDLTFPEGLEKILDEICRAEGHELHNIASIMGGIVAQEVIKILTNQYVTLDNCLAFDGISSFASSWKV